MRGRNRCRSRVVVVPSRVRVDRLVKSARTMELGCLAGAFACRRGARDIHGVSGGR